MEALGTSKRRELQFRFEGLGFRESPILPTLRNIPDMPYTIGILRGIGRAGFALQGLGDHGLAFSVPVGLALQKFRVL